MISYMCLHVFAPHRSSVVPDASGDAAAASHEDADIPLSTLVNTPNTHKAWPYFRKEPGTAPKREAPPLDVPNPINTVVEAKLVGTASCSSSLMNGSAICKLECSMTWSETLADGTVCRFSGVVGCRRFQMITKTATVVVKPVAPWMLGAMRVGQTAVPSCGTGESWSSAAQVSMPELMEWWNPNDPKTYTRGMPSGTKPPAAAKALGKIYASSAYVLAWLRWPRDALSPLCGVVAVCVCVCVSVCAWTRGTVTARQELDPITATVKPLILLHFPNVRLLGRYMEAVAPEMWACGLALLPCTNPCRDTQWTVITSQDTVEPLYVQYSAHRWLCGAKTTPTCLSLTDCRAHRFGQSTGAQDAMLRCLPVPQLVWPTGPAKHRVDGWRCQCRHTYAENCTPKRLNLRRPYARHLKRYRQARWHGDAVAWAVLHAAQPSLAGAASRPTAGGGGRKRATPRHAVNTVKASVAVAPTSITSRPAAVDTKPAAAATAQSGKAADAGLSGQPTATARSPRGSSGGGTSTGLLSPPCLASTPVVAPPSGRSLSGLTLGSDSTGRGGDSGTSSGGGSGTNRGNGLLSPSGRAPGGASLFSPPCLSSTPVVAPPSGHSLSGLTVGSDSPAEAPSSLLALLQGTPPHAPRSPTEQELSHLDLDVDLDMDMGMGMGMGMDKGDATASLAASQGSSSSAGIPGGQRLADGAGRGDSITTLDLGSPFTTRSQACEPGPAEWAVGCSSDDGDSASNAKPVGDGVAPMSAPLLPSSPPRLPATPLCSRNPPPTSSSGSHDAHREKAVGMATGRSQGRQLTHPPVLPPSEGCPVPTPASKLPAAGSQASSAVRVRLAAAAARVSAWSHKPRLTVPRPRAMRGPLRRSRGGRVDGLGPATHAQDHHDAYSSQGSAASSCDGARGGTPMSAFEQSIHMPSLQGRPASVASSIAVTPCVPSPAASTLAMGQLDGSDPTRRGTATSRVGKLRPRKLLLDGDQHKPPLLGDASTPGAAAKAKAAARKSECGTGSIHRSFKPTPRDVVTVGSSRPRSPASAQGKKAGRSRVTSPAVRLHRLLSSNLKCHDQPTDSRRRTASARAQRRPAKRSAPARRKAHAPTTVRLHRTLKVAAVHEPGSTTGDNGTAGGHTVLVRRRWHAVRTHGRPGTGDEADGVDSGGGSDSCRDTALESSSGASAGAGAGASGAGAGAGAGASASAGAGAGDGAGAGADAGASASASASAGTGRRASSRTAKATRRATRSRALGGSNLAGALRGRLSPPESKPATQPHKRRRGVTRGVFNSPAIQASHRRRAKRRRKQTAVTRRVKREASVVSDKGRSGGGGGGNATASSSPATPFRLPQDAVHQWWVDTPQRPTLSNHNPTPGSTPSFAAAAPLRTPLCAHGSLGSGGQIALGMAEATAAAHASASAPSPAPGSATPQHRSQWWWQHALMSPSNLPLPASPLVREVSGASAATATAAATTAASPGDGEAGGGSDMVACDASKDGPAAVRDRGVAKAPSSTPGTQSPAATSPGDSCSVDANTEVGLPAAQGRHADEADVSDASAAAGIAAPPSPTSQLPDLMAALVPDTLATGSVGTTTLCVPAPTAGAADLMSHTLLSSGTSSDDDSLDAFFSEMDDCLGYAVGVLGSARAGHTMLIGPVTRPPTQRQLQRTSPSWPMS